MCIEIFKQFKINTRYLYISELKILFYYLGIIEKIIQNRGDKNLIIMFFRSESLLNIITNFRIFCIEMLSFNYSQRLLQDVQQLIFDHVNKINGF